MKKIYTLLLAVLISVNLSAITYTSAQNGNWTNPTTWSPTGVPVPGDIAIINHAVVLNTDFAYTVGSIIVNASGSLVHDATGRDIWVNGVNASLTNNGTTTIRNLLLSIGSYTNTGAFNAKIFANFITANNTATGIINGVDSMYNDGTINNNGMFHVMAFFNDSTINNYGIIQGLTTVVDSMYNKGHILNDVGATIFADSCTNDGTFWNDGRLLFNQFTNLSGNFTNQDYMQLVDMTNIGTFNNNDSVIIGNDITNLGSIQNLWSAKIIQVNNIHNKGNLINASYINASESIHNEGDFYNQNGAILDLGVSLLNADVTNFDATFNNNGTVTMGDSFFNFDTITGGATGSFRVQDSSVNYTNGYMIGSFDFCDLTPPVTPIKIDFNLGSVDANITYCTVTGIVNEVNVETITIYPNPTTGLLNVTSNENITIEIYNVLGEQLLNTRRKNIDISAYDNGMYVVYVKDESGEIIQQSKIVKY